VDPENGEARDLRGESIAVRGETWTVDRQVRYGDCELLGLIGAGRSNYGSSRTILTPFDRPRRLDSPAAVHVLRPRRWLHELQRAALRATPFGGMSAGATGSINLLSYQLEPALALFRHGITRLLIADGVGLGKTIQAGLILSEIASRDDEARGLVVVPAGLRRQWSSELARHFGLDAIVADAAWLARTARELPPEVNPWGLPGIYLTSVDFLKQPEVLRTLEDLAWDVVAVDEAHAVGFGTARRTAVHAVAVRSRAVVLLTATPHGGDAAQFDTLCGLGRRDGDPPVTIFCRSRGELNELPSRRTAILRVTPTPSEQRMHRLLDRYAACVCREAAARRDAGARLAIMVLRKRALSSAASLLVSVARRAELLAGRAAEGAGDPRQLALPLDGEDPPPDAQPDAVLAAPGLADPDREGRFLAQIGEAAQQAAAAESKVAFLLRLLARMTEPAIVFTEYRDTLARLASILARTGRPMVLMHGGLSLADRAAAQRAFNAGGGLLLATDAAAEGLNLHACCRTIVHYELPWNPARLEQRAGRVDRIGQARRVHEMALVADDTAERLVLAALVRRAANARRARLGQGSTFTLITESLVAGAILDGTALPEEAFRPSSPANAPPAELTAEAKVEVRRLTCRVWLKAERGAALPKAIAVSAVGRRRSTRSSAITCIYRARIGAAGASVLHEELIAVGVRRAGRVPPTARRARADARSFLASEPALRSAVRDWLEPRLRAVSELAGRAASTLEAREVATASLLNQGVAGPLQPALFDDRAIRARTARQLRAQVTTGESERRVAALGGRRALVPRLDLVAILFSPGGPPP